MFATPLSESTKCPVIRSFPFIHIEVLQCNIYVEPGNTTEYLKETNCPIANNYNCITNQRMKLLTLQVKSRKKYQGMFEMQSLENNYKFGKKD